MKTARKIEAITFIFCLAYSTNFFSMDEKLKASCFCIPKNAQHSRQDSAEIEYLKAKKKFYEKKKTLITRHKKNNHQREISLFDYHSDMNEFLNKRSKEIKNRKKITEQFSTNLTTKNSETKNE